MSLLSFAQWVQFTGLFTALRQSHQAYPIVLTLHMTGLAMFGAMVLVTDLRLLGVFMRNIPVSEVVNQLRVPKRVGLVFIATCGILLAGSKAEEYYYNAFFRTKLILFALLVVHALVFRRVYADPSKLDTARETPLSAKLAGSLSLLLWTCVLIAGRGIGYIDPNLDLIHARWDRPSPGVFCRGVVCRGVACRAQVTDDKNRSSVLF